MRSIDAAREFLGKSPSVVYPQDVIEYVDAIEREIEEGYVELPKDADGEYIHIGDRVEDNERVARIVLTDGSWEPSVYIEKLPSVLHEYFCNEISHYHKTVEDLLFEMYDRLDEPNEADRGRGAEDIIREYAPLLQLKEED